MRTKRSVNNIISTIVFNIIVGILGFLKARVFIYGLTDDIYSLNQLFCQIFSYIAIADLGLGLILNQRLYKAFAKDDKEEINRIYSTSKKFYQIIGIFMFGIAFILSFFVQYLTKADISFNYLQIIFLVFMIRNVIEYFFIAPRLVLEADQQYYKANYLIKGSKILETIIEIALVLLGVNYLIILIPGIFLTILMCILVNKKIYKMYPWLNGADKFNKKYLSGTKNVIWQKIAGLLDSNTDIILISSFISPLSVIIYTSYNYVTKFIIDTIYIIGSAITPSFANLLLKDNAEKSYETSNEINIFFLFIASFVFIMLYGFLNSLIKFWVGDRYVANNFTLFLFCLIAFQKIAERVIVLTINSKALFKETKVSVILEALINLVISVLLINKLGIVGVLLGTIISRFITTFIQQPIYIYKNVFKKSCLKYYFEYIGVLAITMIFILGFNLLNLQINTVLQWIALVIGYAIGISIILGIIYYILFKSFRSLIKRGLEYIKNFKLSN